MTEDVLEAVARGAIPRTLMGMVDVKVEQDMPLDFVETQEGRIEINPAIPLKANELYRVQLWNDGTVSVWQLIAEGFKPESQIIVEQ